MTKLLELENIKKIYPSTATIALDGVDFSVGAGEIHALAGENAAGKSTLAKIICGFEKCDSGIIKIDGQKKIFSNHNDAKKCGIGFVPQYSMLSPVLKAYESLFLGKEIKKYGLFTNDKLMKEKFIEISEHFGFSMDPEKLVSSMQPKEKRQLEILCALNCGGKIIVLDEPTSILGENDLETLFSILEKLKSEGKGIIFISHRANEIIDVADKISIMNNGKIIHSLDLKKTSENNITLDKSVDKMDASKLATLIFGQTSVKRNQIKNQNFGKTVLEFQNVSCENELNNINFKIRENEIVAVVAHEGNGLDILEQIATNLDKTFSGTIKYCGKSSKDYTYKYLRNNVFSYIPTDREKNGICLKAHASANVIADTIDSYSFKQFAFEDKAINDVKKMLSSFSVKNWEKGTVATLSGGNRQRLVLSRELAEKKPLIIAANPVQALDLVARKKVLERLLALKEEGSAILLLTIDLEDASDIADTIYVMYRGKIQLMNDANKASLSGVDTKEVKK